MSDLISRQAAIDALKRDEEYDEDIPNRADGVRDAIITISNLPTATDKKKGEWISHYDYCKKHGLIPSVLISLWWCDQCEQGAEHPTNFCPNCGADMRGDKDE